MISNYIQNKFILNSKFLPAGDQPEAIKNLVDGINKDLKFQTLYGVTGSGKTFTMANIIEKTNKPALIMVNNKTLAAQLYSEFREFFPQNAVEYFVSYYDYYQPEAYVPHKDLYIEKDSSINEHIDQMRLSATKSLLQRNDVIIVASVSAIYGIGDEASYQHMILQLKEGETINRNDLIIKLVEMQYIRCENDFSRGTFRVRGEKIDVFPAEHFDFALRISLFDDEIENLFLFDPLTGKMNKKISIFTIFPSSHYVTPKDTIKIACDLISNELEKRVLEFNALGKSLEAYRIKQRTEFDLEMLRETGFCKGIENYSLHMTKRSPGSAPPTLIDYLPNNALLFIDESHITIPQIGAMYNGDQIRKNNLVEYGFRLPSALDNRPLKFDEFESKMPQTIFVSATPGEYESKFSLNVVEQLIRPTGIIDPIIEVRDVSTQVDDLLHELRIRIAKNERVLATTLTKKMSEKLSEYYADHGIKIKYLHSDIDTVERVEIIKDLRLGVYDAIVGVNLLREGLDIPEVSLVAILDADKEGFLRSGRSLIQTTGRAARNINGMVIFYAEKITKSMKFAIEETYRRRNKQIDFNTKNNIIPQALNKPIIDIIDGIYKNNDDKFINLEIQRENLTDLDVAKLIKQLEKKMKLCVSNLEFESAAKLRDKIKELRNLLIIN